MRSILESAVWRGKPSVTPHPVMGENHRIGYLENKLEAALAQLRRADNRIAELVKSEEDLERELESSRQEIIKLSKIILQSATNPNPKEHPIDRILDEVLTYYKVSMIDLLANRRAKPMPTVRCVAMYIARQLTMITSGALGQIMKRDPSTVTHGIRVIENRRKWDAALNVDIVEIINRINSPPVQSDWDKMWAKP